MNLPAGLREQLEHAAGETLLKTAAVSGGCISQTARLEFASGSRVFLKWDRGAASAAMVAEEAKSLAAIAATQTVRVPRVLHIGNADGFAWLMLEWLEPGRSSQRNQRLLGERLAALHRHSSNSYGWPSDNFIGSLPQSNRAHEHWVVFWRTQRLEPQLRSAGNAFDAVARKRFDAVTDRLHELLAPVEHEPPSLLHGDLWSGNVHMLADGSAAVIDPSAYYGHREVDIAMSRLFGGFTRDFYDAYAEVWPHEEGLHQRVALYQLYYLLVHVNLLGGSYVHQALSVLSDLGF